MVRAVLPAVFASALLTACSGAPAESEHNVAQVEQPVRNSKSNPWSVDAPEVGGSNKVAVGGTDRTSASARIAAARPDMAAQVGGGGGGNVSLTRQSDGHFYANISVDSQDVRVMVDTGASIIALTGDDARSLGLDWSADEVRPIGRGASGDVYGVPTLLGSVELDGIRARNVEAVIVPEGLDVTLLGQSFLRQVGRVEISGNTMVLED